MTPPSATAAALRVPVQRSEPVSQPRVALSPAHPAAVIIPPVVLYLVTIAVATMVHGLTVSLTYTPSVWTLLRAGTLAALQLPALYVVRAAAEGAGGRRLAQALVPAMGAVLVVALDALLPGEFLHPATLFVIWGVSVSAQPAARRWRDWWVRYRPRRVSLLASTEWGAQEAIDRLEHIPGLMISNVVIPGCNIDTSTRLLGRPTSHTAAGAMRLERRVIVSSPLKDPAVGALIAQMVALGHSISSESSLHRAAEGRVCTLRADPLNLLMSRPSHWFHDLTSRVLDVVLAAGLLVLTAPLFLLVATAIALETGAPVFYRQRRVGMRGRLFDVVKFRSMYVNAEQMSGPVWAAQDDPRVTKVGRFIRKYRLDELPQLFNVLVGHMALVGPRPERPHFFSELRRDVPIFELRTCVRPGVTGWAQVRAPYAAGIEDSREKLEFDLYYVLHRSLWMDMAILLETAGVALRGSGAR